MNTAPAPHQAPAKNRLSNLDLLRLAAALMVIFFHYTYSGHATGEWNRIAFAEIAPVTQHFWTGVSLFFIISGFVIAYSAQNRTAMDFAIARAARLYPAFILCMSVTALGLYLAGPPEIIEFRMTLARWLAGFLMFSPALKQPFVDGAYWSIIVEVVFYGWVTALIALGLFERRQLEILALWLAISLANEFIFENYAMRHLLITKFSGYFALGVLTFRVHAAKRWPQPAEMALAAMAILLSARSNYHMHVWMQANYSGAPEWSLGLTLAIIVGMVALINLAIRVPPLLNPALCAVLGGLTYPLYLLHQNLGYAAFYHLGGTLNRWALLAVLISAMMLAAWAVFRFIEPPGRRLVFAVGDMLKTTLARRLRPVAKA